TSPSPEVQLRNVDNSISADGREIVGKPSHPTTRAHSDATLRTGADAPRASPGGAPSKATKMSSVPWKSIIGAFAPQPTDTAATSPTAAIRSGISHAINSAIAPPIE